MPVPIAFENASFAANRFARWLAFAWVRRHFAGLTLAAALSLAFFGVLLTLDRLSWVTVQLQNALRSVGLERLLTLG